MNLMRVALAVAALGLGVPDANAQLTGHTLTADWWYPAQNQSIETHTIVVGPGVELPASSIVNDIKFDIDVGDNTVTFLFNATSNWSSTSFNGWRFADTNGTIPPIASYAVDSYSAGIGNVGVVQTFNTADSFYANFAGMTVVGAGDYITLRVNFVPTPGAAALLGLGGLAALRRRR